MSSMYSSSSVASKSRASSTSRMSRASGIGSRASGLGSAISSIHTSAISGIGSALSTISNINNDKKIYKKVLPFDIVFMQKMLKIFNFIGLFFGLIILAVVMAALMTALNENCLVQPYNPLTKPTQIQPRPEGYMCTGNRLIAPNDTIPKINMVLMVVGLFFAVQAKLFGFMGSAFMIIRHLFIYVMFFMLAYMIIGISSLIELGTKYHRQLLNYFGIPKWILMILFPYAIFEICMLIATLRLAIRWKQFLRGRG